MSQTILKGSCLCGTVKYEVTGEPKRFLPLPLLALSQGDGYGTCLEPFPATGGAPVAQR